MPALVEVHLDKVDRRLRPGRKKDAVQPQIRLFKLLGRKGVTRRRAGGRPDHVKVDARARAKHLVNNGIGLHA